MAIVLLGLLAVFWGANWPIMKVGLEEIPPFVYRAASSGSAAIGLFLIAKMGGHSLAVPRGERKGLVIAAVLNMSLWNLLILYGVYFMDSGRAAILAYTMPLWATVAGVFLLHERLGARAIAALILGLFGMLLLFVGDEQALSGGWMGPAMILVAAVSWGVGTVLMKYYAFSMTVTVTTAWQHAIGGLPIAVIALVWDIHNIPDEVHLIPVLTVVYNMTITGIFCYWAYFKVVSMLPVVVSTVGTLMVPVLGVFFNAIGFSIMPGWVDYVALAAVIAAVFLVMTRGRRG